MHVVIASHDLYPDPGSGGTGRYVYETARRLADRGHEVSVVTRRRGDVPTRETVAGIDVARYDLSVAETPGPAVLARLPRAVRTVDRFVPDHPDLLSLQGPVTGALAHAVVERAVPRRCTFHSPWPTEYGIRTRDTDRGALRRRLNAALRDRIERRLLGSVEEVGTLSEYMHGRLRERYDPAAPTRIVAGGVDVEVFAPDAGRHERVAGGGPTFLTVRRLSPRMGHGMLLEAFARVREDHPDAELYVAGDGPLAGKLRERATGLGVDDATTFLGYVPDGALPAAYASADVFVLPTTELEGFGLATLEALASGTPVVGTRVGGTVEILEGAERRENVPARMLSSVDAETLATRMNDWARLDRGTRERAERACRAYVESRYTWERTVDALERRYRALTETR